MRRGDDDMVEGPREVHVRFKVGMVEVNDYEQYVLVSLLFVLIFCVVAEC